MENEKQKIASQFSDDFIEIKPEVSDSEPHLKNPVMEDFDILKTLHKGLMSKVLLVRNKNNGEKMVLKLFDYEAPNILDNFQKELSINYTLSPHPNIVNSFNVSFNWNSFLIYAQEWAPYSDLTKAIRKNLVISPKSNENYTKSIIKQVGSGLEFMQTSFKLIHSNVRGEKILVFTPDYSVVKITDFGSCETEGTHVSKCDYEDSSYLPPEISQILPGEKYYIKSSIDAWQLGILIFYCFKGTTPWSVADITDPSFSHYNEWHRRKSLKIPDSFKSFTPRLLRLLKRLLEPKERKRYGVAEVFKYLEDRWLIERKSSIFDTSPSPKNLNLDDAHFSPSTKINFMSRRRQSAYYVSDEKNEKIEHRPRSSSTSPSISFLRKIRRGSASPVINRSLNEFGVANNNLKESESGESLHSKSQTSFKAVKFSLPAEENVEMSLNISKIVININEDDEKCNCKPTEMD